MISLKDNEKEKEKPVEGKDEREIRIERIKTLKILGLIP